MEFTTLNATSSLLENFVTTYNKEITKMKNRSEAQDRKMIELLRNVNEGLVPKIDRLGRYHAAADGYCDVSGHIYQKGQYIPMPDDLIEEFPSLVIAPKPYYTKIKMVSDTITEFRSLLAEFENENGKYEIGPITFSFGKEWESFKPFNGSLHSFLYIETRSKHLFPKIREALFKDVEKYIEEKVAEAKEILSQSITGESPEGRETIRGKVLGLPVVEGYYGMTCKVMVELDNGTTVYGTLPTKLYDAELGDVIEFTATFNRAEDSTTHSFFKRPSKPSFIKGGNNE